MARLQTPGGKNHSMRNFNNSQRSVFPNINMIPSTTGQTTYSTAAFCVSYSSLKGPKRGILYIVITENTFLIIITFYFLSF